MNEKIEEIEACISKIILDDKGMLINTEAWIEDYKLLKNAKPWIEYLLSFLKKYQVEKRELEKIISDGILKDHNGCEIFRDEEYTKLESKFYEAETRVKELEESWANYANTLLDKAIKEKEKLEAKVRELEVDLKLNASMLAKQTDLAREAETKARELEKGIQEIIDSGYMNSLNIKNKLKKLVRNDPT